MIFHDHLSQWWEKEAQEYIHSKHNFRHRQLRCVGTCNEGTRYENKLVGDSPELCRGLDSHGFADLKRSMDYHVALSSVYEIGDERRFSMGTPKEVENTMARCWTLEPTSERIIEDIMALPMILQKIIEHNGCVVQDEYLRHGRRFRRADDKGDTKHKPRKRQRKETNTTLPPCHPQCDEARKTFLQDLWTTYENTDEVLE
eukprot:Lithocolla_globosa_v1_NODE_207_length_5169_cov_7.885329.p3 type:complete len:201 gc:universal NODE_207_length_5169_cov_7.885329:2147-2749(+)